MVEEQILVRQIFQDLDAFVMAQAIYASMTQSYGVHRRASKPECPNVLTYILAYLQCEHEIASDDHAYTAHNPRDLLVQVDTLIGPGPTCLVNCLHAMPRTVRMKHILCRDAGRLVHIDTDHS